MSNPANGETMVSMTPPNERRDDALDRLRQITKGIDADECEDPDGWWETSVGAARGAKVLAELEALIVDLTGGVASNPESTQPSEENPLSDVAQSFKELFAVIGPAPSEEAANELARAWAGIYGRA